MAQNRTINEQQHPASEKSGFVSVRSQSHSGSISKESEDYQSVSSNDASSVMRRWDIETPIEAPLCESFSVSDMCTLCAANEKAEKATHICRDCCRYGRYYCQRCWDNHNKFLPTHDTLSLSVSSDRYERDSSASAQRNASEELEQKVKSLEKETERLQHELQAEKTEKYNVFKRLERDKCAVEEELKRIEKHSLNETVALIKQIKSLRQENDEINSARENDRHHFKAEMKVKECGLQRLEDMTREKCAVEEELKSLLKQSSDDKYALEKSMKRLEDMKREKCAVEEELKSLLKQSSSFRTLSTFVMVIGFTFICFYMII
ncbi:kinesin-like protein KIF16B [Ruditapes philippinarum]|uniref:kinesin-like protein KIF16B n=1 Tax=Ruditapes philippinarum TaxID=129788 RepID=UPI00295B353C|nr:kinesin-like protein KIF16B [Ruditapes philippinarum]